MREWEAASDEDGDPCIISKVYGKKGTRDGLEIISYIDKDAVQCWVSHRIVLTNNTEEPTKSKAYRLGTPRLTLNEASFSGSGLSDMDTGCVVTGCLDLSRPCVMTDYQAAGLTTMRETHANGAEYTCTGFRLGPDFISLPHGFVVGEKVVTGDLHDWMCYTDGCYTGYVFNKPETPNGDWIKTNPRVAYLQNDRDGNRLVETSSGSIYRLIGPQLAALQV